MQGSNYPDGTSGSNPLAPWNQPDPWEGERCGDCDYFYGIPRDVCHTTVGFCRDFGDYVDSYDDACENWKYE